MRRCPALALSTVALLAGCQPPLPTPQASTPETTPSESALAPADAPVAAPPADGAAASRTREATILEVQNDVRRRMEAHYGGDVETILMYHRRAKHGPLKDRIGSDEELRRLAEADVKRFQSDGVKLISVEFPDPPKFAQTPEHLFVVVPQSVIDERPATGSRVRRDSYTVGVLEQGAEGFYYFDAPIPVEGLREAYPDLPENVGFPEPNLTPLPRDPALAGSSPATALPPASERTPEILTAALQADIRKQVEARFADDAETLQRFFPPEAREGERGNEATNMLLFDTQTLRRLKTTVDSIDFPQPPSFYQAEKRLFAVVPYEIYATSTTVPGERHRHVQYAFAILEQDASAFVYPEEMHEEEARYWYPDLPADVQFPQQDFQVLSE